MTGKFFKLKTLFNIVEERFKKVLNFDVSKKLLNFDVSAV